MKERSKVLIKASHISKKYNNNIIIDDIDLEIYDNDFTVIMGPSGAGKSTLLYMLSGMDEVTKGYVFYKNTNIVQMNENQMATLRSKEFGFVFQQTHLVSYLTLYENIVTAGYVLKQSRNSDIHKRTQTLMEHMNIFDVKNHLPSQVSGGEAQRAAIARAIINQPGILFADEPTGALNKANSDQVLDLMGNIHQSGQSILMVTHDLKAAMRGTRLIYVGDGKIIGEMLLEPYSNENEKQREHQIQEWLSSMKW